MRTGGPARPPGAERGAREGCAPGRAATVQLFTKPRSKDEETEARRGPPRAHSTRRREHGALGQAGLRQTPCAPPLPLPRPGPSQEPLPKTLVHLSVRAAVCPVVAPSLGIPDTGMGQA